MRMIIANKQKLAFSTWADKISYNTVNEIINNTLLLNIQ